MGIFSAWARCPSRFGALALVLLFMASGLSAQEQRVSPAMAGEIAGEGTYRLAAGVYRLQPVAVSGALVLLGPEKGEAVLEAAREGVLFEVRGSLTLDGITVAAPPRAEPLIAVEPGGQLNITRNRFTGSGARLRTRGADVRVQDTTFFRAATTLETSGGGSILLRDSEFIGKPGTRAPLLVLGGPASIEIEDCTFRSVERILAADGPASVRVRGAAAAWLGAGGFLVRNPAGAVSFAGLTFEGPCVGAGVHVVGGAPEQPLPPLEIAGIRADAGAGGSGGLGFLTIADPGAFERVVLSDCVLRGAGSAGMQVLSRGEARGANVAISGSALEGWESGIELRAEHSGRFAALVADTRLEDNGVGLDAAGAGLSLEARSLSASANRMGVRVGGGAHAALADARLAHSVEAAVHVGDAGALAMRRTHLLANGIGVDVAEDAGTVDLGQREEAGENRFEVRGARTWAVRAKSPEPIAAFGNTWGEQRPYTGAVAIDDLIDDGDAANPVQETGNGIVLADSQPGRATRLRWDAVASRTTPGYGTDVFRSFADVEPVLGDLEVLELGAGEYVLPVLHTGLRELAGAGRGRTILRPETDATAAVVASGESFVLRDLTILLPEETRLPAVAWTGGKLRLERLAIEGAGPGALRVAPGGQAVEVADVTVTAGGTEGGTVLDVGARPSTWSRVRVTLAGPLTALETHGRASLGHTTILYTAAHEGPGVVLRGEAGAAQLTVTGPCATAVELAAADSPSTATLIQTRLEGFRGAGIRLTGGVGHDLTVRNARLTASDDAGFRAAGLSVAPQARLALRIDDFEATNARPGLDVAGTARAMVLERIMLQLNGSHNAVESEEQGIRLALASGAGRRTLAGVEAGGYDVGLDVTRQHDDATTLVLGNFDARSACRFLRNGIGIRLSSPAARVAMREDRNRSLLAENSAAVLLEAGSLMMENVRVENNQTGVIVRGGVADLGGGALGSRGGNVLWPQAGPFAIVNESPAPVAARHNVWGAMKPFLKTDGAPISDARKDPDVGMVETEPPR
ncbi:MAG: hypothetical protein PWP23_1183 [Candidatus Sumerlaeota bacterium]|nr:hypothetical protein [Candidatus Sumerlaeota bacterium]